MSQTTGTDTEKYDRQLRLWGEEGQARLEKSSICLLNGTATGAETLKNLVLPGIGAFTIVDNQKVAESDLGNNFFVERQSLGQNRSKVVCELLRELNDRVKGSSVEEDPIHLINTNISFFKDFNLVIANRIPEEPLLTLSQYLYENNIALVVVNSYGFIGYLRLSVPEHQVIESKPDTPMDDLRISEPFKELEDYANSINLESLNSQQHSHIAYVLLLIKFFNAWKSTHGGKLPETRPEKEEFKKFFISKSRNYKDELNFNEGVTNLLKAFQPSRVPSDVDQILKDPKTSELTENSDDFWVLAAALKSFVEEHKKLPLHGNVPDMTADTLGFIKLQNIYQDKANEDLSDLTGRVESILSKIGKDTIPQEYIKKFCKNARFLHLARYRSLNEERTQPRTQVITGELEQPDNLMVFYIVLRAVDKFFTLYNRYPGFNDEDIDSDQSLLKNIVNQLLSELQIPTDLVKDDYVNEFTRYGASELHNIASLMGGITSQEIIKLITHQYIPLNNTYIFNGINSTGANWKL
ncbi:amyloid beta precursor protein-binding protein 1 [Tieghemostelium lacteum]|uniref:NEDD8-activating enzyme E1 regulatory subunit n=1 Tax=Tieghemostelium lacteum TaxID=361077 RepID=A0A151Z8F9_TIELA|nr:amyloid beta precursor protein-binding protein 1 [Tieghemostelium lacteum]|eukprot:KYQ90227.1 amyloid beta precursor protein-binding protein 1 [Tieghemostelium lacteum]